MNTPDLSKAIELSKKLAKQEAEAAKLLEELQHSLDIKSVWPDAFQAGACKVWGHQGYYQDRFGREGEPNGLIFLVIEAGNGVRYYLNKEEVLKLRPKATFSPKWDTYFVNVAGGGVHSGDKPKEEK